MSEQIALEAAPIAAPSSAPAIPAARYTFRFPDATTPGALGIYAQAGPAIESMRRVVTSLKADKMPAPADIEALADALSFFADDPDRAAVKRYIYEQMTITEYVQTITALLNSIKQ